MQAPEGVAFSNITRLPGSPACVSVANFPNGYKGARLTFPRALWAPEHAAFATPRHPPRGARDRGPRVPGPQIFESKTEEEKFVLLCRAGLVRQGRGTLGMLVQTGGEQNLETVEVRRPPGPRDRLRLV